MSLEKLARLDTNPEPINSSHYQVNNARNNIEAATVSSAFEIGGALTNSINCQVCRNFINLDQKENNLVVKCNNCNEATPIKAAPPGKKYVRCTCNGLLICKSSSTRVGCPRPQCKAVITLTPNTDDIGVTTGITSQTNLLGQQIRVSCVNCSSLFILSVGKHKKYILAKCPHCQRNSSVGPYYARLWLIVYLFLGIILISLGIGITVGTYKYAIIHGGYYVLYVGLFIAGVLSFIRSAMYCFMPISTVEPTLVSI